MDRFLMDSSSSPASDGFPSFLFLLAHGLFTTDTAFFFLSLFSLFFFAIKREREGMVSRLCLCSEAGQDENEVVLQDFVPTLQNEHDFVSPFHALSKPTTCSLTTPLFRNPANSTHYTLQHDSTLIQQSTLASTNRSQKSPPAVLVL